MQQIFGRASGEPYGKLGDLAAEFLRSGLIDQRAVARNLMHDHRVSSARGANFYEWAGRPVDSLSLQRAVANYRWDRVRLHPDLTFLHENNRNNFIEQHGASHALAQVLDLNGLTKVFRLGRRRGIPELQDVPSHAAVKEEEIAEVLEGKLGSVEDRKREAAIDAILNAVNLTRDSEDLEDRRLCAWAASWDVFEARAGPNPESWQIGRAHV